MAQPSLHDRAQKVDELESHLASLRRQYELEKAGVDTSHPLARYVLENAADVEDIAATARQLGLPVRGQESAEAAEAEAPPPPVAPFEPSGTAERQALALNSPADEQWQEDPRRTAERAAAAIDAQGGTQDDKAAAFLSTLAEAANAGDPRVVLPPNGRREGW